MAVAVTVAVADAVAITFHVAIRNLVHLADSCWSACFNAERFLTNMRRDSESESCRNR
jgi:hypothetical protein